VSQVENVLNRTLFSPSSKPEDLAFFEKKATPKNFQLAAWQLPTWEWEVHKSLKIIRTYQLLNAQKKTAPLQGPSFFSAYR